MGFREGSKNGDIKGQKLLQFESVKNWLSSLEQSALSRGKPFTLMAKRQRLGRLLEFTKSTGLNPDQLLEEAKTSIDSAGKRLNQFFEDKVKSGVDHNTACTNISFLRGFYTHNNLVFPKRYRLPRRKVSAVSKTDAKTEIYGFDESTNEPVFHNGTLKHFFDNLSFRDQTIGLCLISTGADASDILDLKIEFVKDGKGDKSTAKRFFFNGNRKKDGIEFKTFFSAEATEYLKRYVEQERSNAKNDEYIFLTEKWESKDGSKNGGKRVPAHTLAMNFRKASEKMGYSVTESANPFRPKRFRRLFRTACSLANVDTGYVMAMMGHASNISSSYLEKSDGLFLKEYLKLEPYVTVYGVDKSVITEMNESVTEIKIALADLAVEKDGLMKRLGLTEKELEARKAEVERLKSIIESYKVETDKKMNFFSMKIDKIETYMHQNQKEEKKKKKDDYGIIY